LKAFSVADQHPDMNQIELHRSKVKLCGLRRRILDLFEVLQAKAHRIVYQIRKMKRAFEWDEILNYRGDDTADVSITIHTSSLSFFMK
jgi:hypothetical protein